MAKSAKKPEKPRGRPFTPETARTVGKVPGPGRSAGYKSWSAELFAFMLESPGGKVTQKNPNPPPFAIAAIEKYKQKVLSGTTGPLLDFMNQLFSTGMIDKLDDILANQKNHDKGFMRFRVFDRLFDEQQAVFISKKKNKFMVCGRRSGKTEEIAAEIVGTAVESDAGNVLYIGKTHTAARDLIWQRVIDNLKVAGISYTAKISEQVIVLSSGVEIWVRGAHNLSDIDKLRGFKWRLVVIDEAQSIRLLKYLVEEVVEPALADYNGTLIMAGTPPRISGTYFEKCWNDAGENPHKARYHWDMSVNPHMPNHKTILDEIMERRAFKPNDPVFLREYKGIMGVYDTDALVYRLEERNYFTDAQLDQWIKNQPVSDLRLIGGLDYGADDSDAFCLILWSISKPESFLLYEYKKAGSGVQELVNAIRKGLDYARDRFKTIRPDLVDSVFIYADTSGKKISIEMQANYKLPIYQAYKANKDLGISMLQDEVKAGNFRVRKGGDFDTEAQSIIFKRNEDDDTLTREIDDDVFHGDMSDAVLYAKRPLYMAGKAQTE